MEVNLNRDMAYDFAMHCLENSRPYPNVCSDMQIVKTVFYKPEEIESAMKEHITSLGLAALYGQQSGVEAFEEGSDAFGPQQDIENVHRMNSVLDRGGADHRGAYYIERDNNLYFEYLGDRLFQIKITKDCVNNNHPAGCMDFASDSHIFQSFWTILSEVALRREGDERPELPVLVSPQSGPPSSADSGQGFSLDREIAEDDVEFGDGEPESRPHE